MNALMRQRDLMEYMNVSRSTLWRMTQREDFPKPVLLMGLKRWRRDELESWLSSRQENSAAQITPAC